MGGSGESDGDLGIEVGGSRKMGGAVLGWGCDFSIIYESCLPSYCYSPCSTNNGEVCTLIEWLKSIKGLPIKSDPGFLIGVKVYPHRNRPAYQAGSFV